jgi:PBP1b-binding outer membrane lipoprotein LpoB
MKKPIIVASIVLLTFFVIGCSSGDKHEMNMENNKSDNTMSHKMTESEDQSLNQKYVCTMHPEEISDHPRECSICGMNLVKK